MPVKHRDNIKTPRIVFVSKDVITQQFKNTWLYSENVQPQKIYGFNCNVLRHFMIMLLFFYDIQDNVQRIYFKVTQYTHTPYEVPYRNNVYYFFGM